MVHELVLTIIELAAPPPSYKSFLQILMAQHLFFILTFCFQLQKLSVWLGNSMI